MSSTLGDESWRDLDPGPADFGALRARWLSERDVAIAVDHEGRRHLLLPLLTDEVGFIDRRSRGLSIDVRSLAVEGRPLHPFLDVCCVDRAAHGVFDQVADGLLEELAAGRPTAEAVRGAVGRWRRFWGGGPIEGLDVAAILGLFGELWFLAAWLLPRSVDAVMHWTGPGGARHDFQWAGIAIEAKTTTSVRGHIHRINGLDQLDAPPDGRLELFSLRIREEQSAHNSLPVLIDLIGEMLEQRPDQLDLLEHRLAAAGYSRAHEDRYREQRFRVVDERLYRVEENFPRLSAGDLRQGVPAGIERMEYDVNLEGFAHLITARSPDEFAAPESA